MNSRGRPLRYQPVAANAPSRETTASTTTTTTVACSRRTKTTRGGEGSSADGQDDGQDDDDGDNDGDSPMLWDEDPFSVVSFADVGTNSPIFFLDDHEDDGGMRRDGTAADRELDGDGWTTFRRVGEAATAGATTPTANGAHSGRSDRPLRPGVGDDPRPSPAAGVVVVRASDNVRRAREIVRERERQRQRRPADPPSSSSSSLTMMTTMTTTTTAADPPPSTARALPLATIRAGTTKASSSSAPSPTSGDNGGGDARPAGIDESGATGRRPSPPSSSRRREWPGPSTADASTVVESVLTDEMSEAGMIRRRREQQQQQQQQQQQRALIHRRGLDLKKKADELERRRSLIEAEQRQRHPRYQGPQCQRRQEQEHREHRDNQEHQDVKPQQQELEQEQFSQWPPPQLPQHTLPQQDYIRPASCNDQASAPLSEFDLVRFGRCTPVDTGRAPSPAASRSTTTTCNAATIGEYDVTDVNTTKMANIRSNTDEVAAITTAEEVDGPMDEAGCDSLTKRLVENAIQEATWRKREQQFQRQRQMQHVRSLPVPASPKTSAPASLHSSSVSAATSPVARLPPVYPNGGRRTPSFFFVTSPSPNSSFAATTTASAPAVRIHDKISSLPPLSMNAAASATMTNDNPPAKSSSLSALTAPERVRRGLTALTPCECEEASPAPSVSTRTSRATSPAKMIGLYPHRQATDTTNDTAVAAAGHRQQYWHQHHQAEPSPTRSDHSADNAAGVGNGRWRVGGPSPPMEPPSLASDIANSSPSSVISNNGYDMLDDLRRRIFHGVQMNNCVHRNKYDNGDHWRGAAGFVAGRGADDFAAEEGSAIQKNREGPSPADAAAAILEPSLDISSSSMPRSFLRPQNMAVTTSPGSPSRGLGDVASFDGQIIARRVSWDEAEYESSPTYLPKNLNLETKLSKLHQGQQRSSGIMIGKAHSFDSASGNSKSRMSRTTVSSVANSVQPSVESECVRQNAEFFHEMMKGDFMDFFVAPTVVRAVGYGEQSTVSGDDNDGFDHSWAGRDVRSAQSSCTPPGLGFSVIHGLKPLPEEEEEELLLAENDANNRGDENDQYHQYDCESLEYILLNSMRVPTRRQRHTETTKTTPLTEGVDAKPSLSSIHRDIMPSSPEYDDSSIFGTNSLISDDSSQISDLRPLVELSAQLSPQPSLQAQRSVAAAQVMIASKQKDLAKFFDKVSENILSGCNDYDNESSDIFLINNSHFGREDDDVLSEKSESKNRFLTPIAQSNNTVPFRSNISKGGEEKADWNDSRQHCHLQSQQTNPNPFSSATVTTSEAYSKTTLNLPPASSFLSDTTPLRTNTTRARNSYGNASVGITNMTSINEGMMDLSEEDLNIDSNDLEEGFAESCPCDEQGAVFRASDVNESNRAQRRDGIESPDRATPAAEQGAEVFVISPADAVGFEFDDDFDVDHTGSIKVTSHEKLKGHSMAWDGVNDDVHYTGRASLASQLSLTSISSNTAILQQHFVIDDEQLRDGARSFYRPSYRSDTAEGSLGLIQESSFGDSACRASHNDEGVYSRYEADDSLCYTHDDFVKDFKAILPQEQDGGFIARAPNANVVELEEQEISLPSLGKTILNDGAHDSYCVFDQYTRRNHRQHEGQATTPSPGINSHSESTAHVSSKIIQKEHVGLRPSMCKTTPGVSALHASDIVHSRQNRQPNEGLNPVPRMMSCPDSALRVSKKNDGSGLIIKQNIASSIRVQSHNHPKIPNTRHHPHHVPNEVSKSKLEEKLRGLPEVTGKVLKRDPGDNSVDTSELGSLLTRDSDFRYGVLPVPKMIFHRTNPDSSALSSTSCSQNTYNGTLLVSASSTRSKITQGNMAAPIQHTPSDDDCYITKAASQVSEFISTFSPVENEQIVSHKHQLLPYPAKVLIKESENRSAETPQRQKLATAPPRQKMDAGNVVIHQMKPNVADSIVKIEGPSSSQGLGQKTFTEMELIAEKTVGTDDIVMQHKRSQATKMQPKSNDVSRSINIAEIVPLFHSSYYNSTEKNGKTRSSPVIATSELGRKPQMTKHMSPIAMFNKSYDVVPKVIDDASQHSSIFEAFEVAPLRTFAHIGEISTPDCDTLASLNDLGVHHAYGKRVPHLSPQAQASLYSVTNQSACQRSSAVASRSIAQYDVVRKQSSSQKDSKSIQYEPTSLLTSNNASIQTPPLAASVKNSCKSRGGWRRWQPHAAQHYVDSDQSSSQENPKPLKYEPTSLPARDNSSIQTSPPLTASVTNNSKLAGVGSRRQPQVNSAGSKGTRQDIITQRVRKGWRKLVMGGLPGVGDGKTYS